MRKRVSARWLIEAERAAVYGRLGDAYRLPRGDAGLSGPCMRKNDRATLVAPGAVRPAAAFSGRQGAGGVQGPGMVRGAGLHRGRNPGVAGPPGVGAAPDRLLDRVGGAEPG